VSRDHAALGPFGDAIEFIFRERVSQAGTVRVGGLGEMWDLTSTHLVLSLVATAIATAIALPLGIWLGHIGRFQFLATSISNIGRAVPALGLIVFFIAFLGVGFTNVCAALVLLAIPRSSRTPTSGSVAWIPRRWTPRAASA
jgi:ABC-type proline/glycine betaine transport system permease subunit